ncbi:transposase [Streptomyces sioyaensis]|uniref:transposase n=1 Tax=Streptomyces sioyaensis TaxID=67364 RepID=UPI0037D8724F
MTETEISEAADGGQLPPEQVEAVLEQLMDSADAVGAPLAGEGGLLQQLSKALLERALQAEMSEHLGYEKGDPAGRGSGNSRNGAAAKTVLTDVGPVEVEVPRDRNGAFEPQIVPKNARRLSGFDEQVLALYAPRHDGARHPVLSGEEVWNRRVAGPHLEGDRCGQR